jgi:hypothetical protein
LIWSAATFLRFPDWRSNWNAAVLTQMRWLRQNRKWCWTLSQNTISRMNLNKGRSAGNGAYMQKGTTSEGDGSQ